MRVQGSWGWGSGFKVRSRACLEQNKVKGSQAERRGQGSGGNVPQSYLISEFLCPILSLFLAFHSHTHTEYDTKLWQHTIKDDCKGCFCSFPSTVL